MTRPHIAVLAVFFACSPCDAAKTRPELPKRVRAPAAAGRFYPADPGVLEAQVARLFANAEQVSSVPVRMLLAPHAGLEFSGPIAARSFKQVTPGFERVVILAANHNGDVNFEGVSVDRSTHYRVPGLEVPVSAVAGKLLSRPHFVDVPAAHTQHMVEIELPFLRVASSGRPFEIVPLVVGQLSLQEVHNVARELHSLLDPKSLVVVSVDLSHYYPYEQAIALDRPCLDALSRSDGEGVARCVTDGTQVLALANELAALAAWTPRFVAYANSGDVGPDRTRVVGYGALVWEDRFVLGTDEGNALVTLARQAVEAKVREGRKLEVPSTLIARWSRLKAPRGAFVTLKRRGQLRGCIGSLAPQRPLAADVLENAINAAIHDPRFPPVQAEELPRLTVSVSVLDLPAPLEGVRGSDLLAHLGKKRPGLILEFNGRRSTFLPEVWEELERPEEFLDHLCAKQGSAVGCWREGGARFQEYGSQHFAEATRP